MTKKRNVIEGGSGVNIKEDEEDEIEDDALIGNEDIEQRLEQLRRKLTVIDTRHAAGGVQPKTEEMHETLQKLSQHPGIGSMEVAHQGVERMLEEEDISEDIAHHHYTDDFDDDGVVDDDFAANINFDANAEYDVNAEMTNQTLFNNVEHTEEKGIEMEEDWSETMRRANNHQLKEPITIMGESPPPVDGKKKPDDKMHQLGPVMNFEVSQHSVMFFDVFFSSDLFVFLSYFLCHPLSSQNFVLFLSLSLYSLIYLFF